jgi:hypothetical protein
VVKIKRSCCFFLHPVRCSLGNPATLWFCSSHTMSQGSSLRRLLAATGLISKQQTSLLIRTLGGQTCPLAALSNDAVTDASRGRSLHTPASPASSSSQNSGGTPELNWVFLGPPGVGKGTYASRIAKRLNIAHIATGDLIRDEIKAGSTVGQQVGKTSRGFERWLLHMLCLQTCPVRASSFTGLLASGSCACRCRALSTQGSLSQMT